MVLSDGNLAHVLELASIATVPLAEDPRSRFKIAMEKGGPGELSNK